MEQFLQETELVDFSNSQVKELAFSLAQDTSSDEECAKKCFTYVRDEIHHSGDFQDNITTYKASDVLKYGTGWCYSKSILLAALLRANNIPTGFCYQRLSCSEYVKDVYCLHGLNAIYLKEFGWYRVDSRGNKEGINAVFKPPHEQLAFNLEEHEYDLDEILEDPLPEVVAALKKFTCYEEMIHNFPDVKEKPLDVVELFSSILGEKMDEYILPPQSYEIMQCSIVKFDSEEKLIVVKVPVLEMWLNPYKTMQGGMIMGAMDNAIGPLSMLVAPKNMTRNVESKLIKPITCDLDYIYITASLFEVKKKRLTFDVVVKDKDENIYAKAKFTNWIV